MKHYLFVVFLALTGFNTFSQEMRISFTDFESGVAKVAMPGYAAFVSAEKQEHAYEASWMNSPDDFLLVKLEEYSLFETYKQDAAAGVIDGKRTYFLNTQKGCYLTVELPDIYAVLIISPSKGASLPQCESLARATGLLNGKGKVSSWPQEIPATARPECEVLSYSMEQPTEGYRFEIRVKVVMSPKLKSSVATMRKTNEDNGSFVNLAGGITLMYPSGELDDLNTCCKDGEQVELLYYIK